MSELTTTEHVELWNLTVPASPEGMALALRTLADKIEQADGALCLVQLAVTGYAEPWEWSVQATLAVEVTP
jgi:hypothetical protein